MVEKIAVLSVRQRLVFPQSHSLMIERSWCQIAPTEHFLCDYANGNGWIESLIGGTTGQSRPLPAAVKAIETTMAPLMLSPAQQQSLEQLRQGAPVIIGGQQVGYLGGPLYTWLKIASIIKHARDTDAVPVFWIEDNDHDLLEAQRASIISRNDELIVLDCPARERYPAQTIVAACQIGQQMTDQLSVLEEQLSGMPHTKSTLALLRRCYEPGRTWSEAFLHWQQLFWAEYGVLFVRSSVLREQGAMQSIIARELEYMGDLAHAVREQTSELLARGYRAQLEVAHINVFFHRRQRRFRLQVDADGSIVAGQHRFSREQLLSHVMNHPEDFSPSAALRPLVQDSLFAPLVSVVGPAELQYHAQLRLAYKRWQIPQPTLVLRHSATIIPERIVRVLLQYREQIENFFAPREQFDLWLASALDRSGLLAKLDATTHAVADLLAEFEQAASHDDITLGRAVSAATHRIERILERLQRKVRHAIRRRYQHQKHRLQSARTHLFPDGRLQERVVAPIHWVCQIGVQQWSAVLQAIAEQSNRMHYIATPNELIARTVGTQVVH